MIKHVVLFKLKDFDSVEERKATKKELKEKLDNMVNFISELKFIETGLNFEESTLFDVCLITHFDSLSDLDSYKAHPEHLKVVEYVNNVVESRSAVDYEF